MDELRKPRDPAAGEAGTAPLTDARAFRSAARENLISCLRSACLRSGGR